MPARAIIFGVYQMLKEIIVTLVVRFVIFEIIEQVVFPLVWSFSQGRKFDYIEESMRLNRDDHKLDKRPFWLGAGLDTCLRREKSDRQEFSIQKPYPYQTTLSFKVPGLLKYPQFSRWQMIRILLNKE
jgi:hypothetical protein